MSIWKKSIASTSTRAQRLLFRLLQYDIDIKYLAGKRNVIADALSRVSPLPPKAKDIKAINCIAGNEVSVNIPASKTKFQESTCRDIILQELAKTVHKGWPREYKDGPRDFAPLLNIQGMHILRKRLIIQGQQANSTRSRKRANLRTITLWTLWDHMHTGQSQRISILARYHQRH